MNYIQSLVTFILLIPLVSADGTFTISSLAAYSSQRVCAQQCFFNAGNNLPNELACQSPYLDSCVCRTDLTSSASSLLSSCINGLCSSDPVDISSAEALYSSYCANVNGPAAAIATATAAGPANGQSSRTVTITATVITANGAVTTSSIAPITTVINQNDPNYNNVITISGSGNEQKGAAAGGLGGASLWFSATLAWGVLGIMMIM